MKSFECGALGPGYRWHASAGGDADLINRVVQHLHDDHDEQMARPGMIEPIRSRIVDGAREWQRPAA